MTYEIYRYIFIGGAALAGIMAVVSILVFFLTDIPRVIGDLSGANARKAIENIRNQNESTGEKTYRSSQVNRERGKITDKISPSGRIIKNPSNSLNGHGAMGTEKLNTAKLIQDNGSNETTVLSAEAAVASETTVLSCEPMGGGETTLLGAERTGNETSVLSSAAMGPAFAIEYEITYIHTDEVIA